MSATLAVERPLPVAAESGAAVGNPFRRAFWSIAALHLLVWTAVPALTQPNAPLDTVEITSWGHEWEWGYYKHPPLPSWLAEAAFVFAGGTLGVYFLAQILVVACLWAVWRLACELVSPRAAFLAVLLAECCGFYNFTTLEFNNNVCMYPFWGLAALFGYWACRDGRSRDFVALGLCLGMGMLAKYSMLTLILPMLGFSLLDRSARRHWRTRGPWLTIGVAAIMFAPHLWWAVDGGLSGMSYMLERTRTDGGGLSRLVNPLRFAALQLPALLPLALALVPLTGWRPSFRRLEPCERFAANYLATVCFGPIALCLAISCAFDIRLHTAYGSQLWMFAGLAAMFWLRLRDGVTFWRRSMRFASCIAGLMVVAAVADNVAAPYLTGKPSRVHFPGRALAAEVTRRWHSRFDRPLPIAAGEWWLAGNVNLYSGDRPTVYGGGIHPDTLELLPGQSLWTSDADLRTRGGAILWSVERHGRDLPVHLADRFPDHGPVETFELEWRTGADLPPITIGLCLVPPRE